MINIEVIEIVYRRCTCAIVDLIDIRTSYLVVCTVQNLVVDAR